MFRWSMTLFPQKGNTIIRTVCTKEFRKPTIQDHAAMCTYSTLFLMIPLLLIFTSYVFILSSILRINSTEGRKKAFSTCSAHLTVVILFYGSALFIYMKPKSKDTKASDEIIGLSYGVVTPMLNPIIYSLRNKEVKEAVKKVLSNQLHLLKI